MTKLLAEPISPFTPPPADVFSRVIAAVLDTAAGFALFTLTVWAWAFAVGDDTSEELPIWLMAIGLVIITAYLTVTSRQGATLGAFALRLRIVRVKDGAPPAFVQAAIRSGLIVGVFWLLTEVNSWLVLAYLMTMIVLPGKRLPHDLLTGTAMVNATRLLPRAPATSKASPDLPPEEALDLLSDLEKLRRRSRDDLHLVSVPMIIMGTVSLLGGLLDLTDAAFERYSYAPDVFWALAVPLTLAAMMIWFRRQRETLGLGAKNGRTVLLVILACVSIPLGFLVGASPVIIGLGFLSLGISRRSPTLMGAAVIFAAVSVAEKFYVFTNLIGVPGAAGIGLGVSLVLMGLKTFREERAE